jgi:protein-L-isoaspartate(D-aspartate) O-methyltransferase
VIEAKGGKLSQIFDFMKNYVDELKKKDCLESEAVEEAFRKVKRHLLLEYFYETDEEGDQEYAGWKFSKKDFDPLDPDPEILKIIYSDQPILTRIDPPSSTSQPALVARMLEDLKLKEGLKVLEIGAGTGYNAALMAEIVGDQSLVTTLDIQEGVVRQTKRLLRQAGYGRIHVLARDGFFGCPENAPYDRIIATVGCTDISFHWVEQLAEEGFMLIPVQHGNLHPYLRLYRDKDRISGRFINWSGFMTIQGQLKIEGLWVKAPWKEMTEKPSREYPLFPAFQDEEDEEMRRDKTSEFYLFLTFKDRRAAALPQGSGLLEERKGAVVIEKDKIRLYNNAEPLYQELKKLYEEWNALGSPKIGDYKVEFLPLEKAPAQGDKVWIIERKFTKQLIIL